MAHKNLTNWSPYGVKRELVSGEPSGPGGGVQRRTPRNSSPKRPKKPKRPRVFTYHEANDRLQDLFYNHGYGERIGHSLRGQFTRFYLLLMEHQKRQNLTRLHSLKDIAIKHFIDSMMVNKITPLKFPLLDMGTGPGFPGVPLKILLGPEKKIILAEGVQKRVRFLKN